MRCQALLMFFALVPTTIAFGQAPPAGKLTLTVVQGDNAINNIKLRTSRDVIVQVEDENHRPVAGAAVLFLLPDQGAGGAFIEGTKTATVLTNSSGQAVARFQPNTVAGKFQIRVTATSQGRQASMSIPQSNAAGAGAGAGSSAGASMSAKTIAIIVVGAAAGGLGACAAAHCFGGKNTTTPPPPPPPPSGTISISGTPAFAPHH